MPSYIEAQELFQSIVNQANAKTVFGEPVSAEGRTIVPVVKIRYGFGGGSGRSKDSQEHGGGGGGGFLGKPLGVIEITREQTRFIPITSNWGVLAALGIGLVLGLLVGSKRIRVQVEKKSRA